MKKINHSILRGFNWLLVSLLGLLGFTNYGCAMKYGSPEDEYEPKYFAIQGKVTSKADGTPIQGIRVKRNPLYMIAMYGVPTPDFSDKSPAYAYTDWNGNYTAPISDTIPEYEVVFEDIDGEMNGSFRDTSIVVKFNTGETIVNVDAALSKKN
jgi:putative lipoprotein (rSAM/lipoprotein system)